MVISGLISSNIYPVHFKARQKLSGLKKSSIQQKNGVFVKIEAPTNWGTPAIMLPPVVFFKRISQKSYANDIHKWNQQIRQSSPIIAIQLKLWPLWADDDGFPRGFGRVHLDSIFKLLPA